MLMLTEDTLIFKKSRNDESIRIKNENNMLSKSCYDSMNKSIFETRKPAIKIGHIFINYDLVRW